MTTINNLVNNIEIDEKEIDKNLVQEENTKKIKFDLSFLKTETGSGEIGEYIQHPLNFNNSEALAQVIRGISGWAGNNLKLAIIDVLFGIFKMIQERRKKIQEANQ